MEAKESSFCHQIFSLHSPIKIPNNLKRLENNYYLNCENKNINPP